MLTECSFCGQGNREMARFCDSCGRPLIQRNEHALREVTVVFCDIVQYTEMSIRLDPGDWGNPAEPVTNAQANLKVSRFLS